MAKPRGDTAPEFSDPQAQNIAIHLFVKAEPMGDPRRNEQHMRLGRGKAGILDPERHITGAQQKDLRQPAVTMKPDCPVMSAAALLDPFMMHGVRLPAR